MSEAAKMLRTMTRIESVEATEVGDADQVLGTVPEWCELVLDFEAQGQKRRAHLTRHDGELIIEVLHSVLHPNTHKNSPVQRLWAELDDVMDYLVDVDEPEPEDKVRARALAEAIALIAQPYAEEPDIDAVRAEAMERWENRQA
jgi:hypothetical protein